jgi:acylphosphatase
MFMPIRKKITVKGFVQNVSYRKQTQRVAGNLGVKGWVRNVSNGTVEACFEGDDRAVDALIAWCAFGPKRSVVDEVVIKKTKYTGRFDDFSIRDDRVVA